jgi:hypothetical protein
VQTPVVVASPTPVPTPTPKAAPTLPSGMVCPDPTPPPMLRMNVKIHGYEGNRIIFDSKPVFPNVNNYCERAGFGNWKYCDSRPEGDPERTACDYLATGFSDETERWGPTWYLDQRPCGIDPTKCAHQPENQFLTVGKVRGTYAACAADTAPLAPEGSRCGEYVLQ